jgi:hypothetical protein
MDSLFVTAAAFILFVITMTKWKSSVTAIFGVCDVNNTTSFLQIVLIQRKAFALYTRTREREKG